MSCRCRVELNAWSRVTTSGWHVSRSPAMGLAGCRLPSMEREPEIAERQRGERDEKCVADTRSDTRVAESEVSSFIGSDATCCRGVLRWTCVPGEAEPERRARGRAPR